jgi:hypothetical protein
MTEKILKNVAASVRQRLLNEVEFEERPFNEIPRYYADNITLDTVKNIAKFKEELKPEFMNVVFKDSNFVDDNAKTNTFPVLRQHGIDDV